MFALVVTLLPESGPSPPGYGALGAAFRSGGERKVLPGR